MRSHSLGRLCLGLGVAAALGAGACRGADGDPGSTESAATERRDMLDVNDVSILFNAPNDNEPFPSMTLDGVSAGGATTNGVDFFTPTQFAEVIAAARQKEIRFENRADDRGNWRIVSMRFDPCAPGIHSEIVQTGKSPDLSKCSVQVRLIAQARGNDVTAHLVFTLGTLATLDMEPFRADLKRISDLSARAGAPTAGKPLGIHPGLLKGDDGVATAVVDFIHRSVRKAVRQDIAFMGLQDGFALPWIFFAGSVAKELPRASGDPVVPTRTFDEIQAGHFVPLERILGGLPGLPRSSGSVKFAPFSGSVVTPLPAAAISTFPLLSGSVTGDPGQLAFKVEDPTVSHFFNRDCVSCHTSTNRTQALQTRSSAARVRVPKGVTAYVEADLQQNTSSQFVWSLRNFGWFAGHPSISLRTVNETAEVVSIMNLGPVPESPNAVAGPGKDCTSVDDEVWNCFLVMPGGTADNCLKSCKEPNGSTPPKPPAPPASGPDFQRTVVFIKANTSFGQSVSLRGGSNCQGRERPDCEIPIEASSGGAVLNWDPGVAARWTTNEEGNAGFSPLNKEHGVGPNGWLVDVMMDCSKTVDPAGKKEFEFKGFVDKPGDTVPAGFESTKRNHVGRCGGVNVVSFDVE